MIFRPRLPQPKGINDADKGTSGEQATLDNPNLPDSGLIEDLLATIPEPLGGNLESAAVPPLPGNPTYRIEWKGSPNFWSGRDGQQAVAICDHIMEGTMASTNNWFKSRRSEASSHFGVAQDGAIWQWVKVEDAAWTNGILQNPDTSLDWLARCVAQKLNPNTCTISIEHEGRSGQPFTEQQYQATLWLHRFLCTTYSIAANRNFIVGHYQITARDRVNCPGPAFPWQRLLRDLQTGPLPDTTGVITHPAGSGSGWTEGVPGVVLTELPPRRVNTSNAYRRRRPSLSAQDGSLLGTLPRGLNLRIMGYTDFGPAYQGQTRWYLIAEADGGGWTHSANLS